ncbi:MAG: Gfo/Idh/MocA family oxidoreductase [Bacilli bacterium]|jgi:predicted dehydrogenase|nr:Gfo/Idh/MocA family oxidoreductase [Acholeplasmataceae bacterium]
MEKVKIAILGFGQRGFVYANIIKEYPDEMELVAVCEINPVKKPLIMNLFQIPEDKYFLNDEEFFKQGKLADILVISTMDRDHYRQAMIALDLGYDLLLEKPISIEREEILAIAQKAKELGRRVAIAHVLRYTAFYQKIKELIQSGRLGKVTTISQTEHVGYYHYAHSYVRGNWRKADVSAPMILAKSCHDLDIIRWLVDKKYLSLSSFGSLSYFKEENAPEGAADHCYKCKVECPFNAVEFYSKNPLWMMIFSLEQDPVKVLSDESLSYSRCVYKSDNDVVDHQVVNILFEDDITASFVMTAFSNEIHRSIKVHGSKAELEGDLEKSEIILKPYGKEQEIIDVRQFADDFSYHSGGDRQMLVDFVRNVKKGEKVSGLTDIENAVESHYMALDAEDSRLAGGKLIPSTYLKVLEK